MKVVLAAFGILLVLASCNEGNKGIIKPMKNHKEKSDFQPALSIEYFDESAKKIISPNTSVKKLAHGFSWTEGPVWIEQGNYLLFSDIPNNKVYKLNAQNDTILYLNPSGCSASNFTGKESGSNGLLLNNFGELVLLQHGDRMISKMDAPLNNPSENYIPLVPHYENRKLNSPNDGVFDSLGNLYFTDPPYGLPNGLEDRKKELPFQGVYCLLVSGELLLDKDLKYPNGIGISPDGRTLSSNILYKKLITDLIVILL